MHLRGAAAGSLSGRGSHWLLCARVLLFAEGALAVLLNPQHVGEAFRQQSLLMPIVSRGQQ